MDSTTQSLKSCLIRTLLFVGCALPGLGLFLVSSVVLLGIFFEASENILHLILAIGGIAGGMVLMLVGVG